ncbi:DEAD/DEAH box helicase [Lacinutrix salivirga]
MSFKKLHPLLKEAIENNGFSEANAFQKAVLPKLKGGANLYAIGPKGCGKTSTLIIGILHKLKYMAEGDSPRAMILVNSKAEALALKDQFTTFLKASDLRVYCAYEEHAIDKQREEIYYGQDIIIGTPKRINKLYFLNSIDFSQLKLFVIEDAEFTENDIIYNSVVRIPESIKSAQYIVFAKNMSAKLERFRNHFMYNAQVMDLG